MKIDLTTLEKALKSLEKGLDRSTLQPSDEELRDAVIQRFEYTYELCWKMLKRQLEKEIPNPSLADQFSFKELIREGAERGYISNPEKWMVYRELRNLTAHTYDQTKAERVRKETVDFFKDAVDLLVKIKKKNA